jgi:hypothetical protein
MARTKATGFSEGSTVCLICAAAPNSERLFFVVSGGVIGALRQFLMCSRQAMCGDDSGRG